MPRLAPPVSAPLPSSQLLTVAANKPNIFPLDIAVCALPLSNIVRLARIQAHALLVMLPLHSWHLKNVAVLQLNTSKQQLISANLAP